MIDHGYICNHLALCRRMLSLNGTSWIINRAVKSQVWQAWISMRIYFEFRALICNPSIWEWNNGMRLSMFHFYSIKTRKWAFWHYATEIPNGFRNEYVSRYSRMYGCVFWMSWIQSKSVSYTRIYYVGKRDVSSLFESNLLSIIVLREGDTIPYSRKTWRMKLLLLYLLSFLSAICAWVIKSHQWISWFQK